MSEHAAIEAIDLRRSFGAIKAVDGISFAIEPGQIVGFLGPNGAGKSTTMRILCGLLEASSGVARVCGIPVALEPERTKKLIGYMPERNPLPEDMRVREYLRYRARLKEIPRRDVKRAVDEAMQLCDLDRKASKRIIGTLSKGYRQRVGIADAVLGTPEVIVMDEPTIGLDPHQILGIRKLINNLRGRMTVMISSHILPEIEMCCDRSIIINHGQIVAYGSAEVLRKEFLPESEYRLIIKADPNAFKMFMHTQAPAASITFYEELDDGFCAYSLSVNEPPEWAESFLTSLNTTPFIVREFSSRTPSLEDIFLAATRRSWDQEWVLPKVSGPSKQS